MVFGFLPEHQELSLVSKCSSKIASISNLNFQRSYINRVLGYLRVPDLCSQFRSSARLVSLVPTWQVEIWCLSPRQEENNSDFCFLSS